MNVSSWLNQAKQSIDRLDAELILADALAKERIFLHAHPEYEIPSETLGKINQNLARRTKNEPLAYILGYREFYGRNFLVTPDVLIPRPETEDAINIALDLQPAKILDVGTGSGCIAITLKKELPNASVKAVDISENALKIAKQNAQNLSADVIFLRSDLLNDLAPQKFDLIVANLPYVDKNWDWLGQELDFEPELALYSQDAGLYDIKRLLCQAEDFLMPGGHLILESDTSQHTAIADYAMKNTNFQVEKDQNFMQSFVLKA